MFIHYSSLSLENLIMVKMYSLGLLVLRVVQFAT
jgi:hypothetical protein